MPEIFAVDVGLRRDGVIQRPPTQRPGDSIPKELSKRSFCGEGCPKELCNRWSCKEKVRSCAGVVSRSSVKEIVSVERAIEKVKGEVN